MQVPSATRCSRPTFVALFTKACIGGGKLLKKNLAAVIEVVQVELEQFEASECISLGASRLP